MLTAHGVWDEPTVQIAKALVDASDKTPLILDIGANMGTFSLPLAKHISKNNGVIQAFEPQRIIYYRLCGNIFLNRMDNIYAHKVAISTYTHESSIDVLNYDAAWNIGAYSLIEGRDKQEKISNKENCNFSRLDDIKFKN